jgi:hypothetical protein
MMIRQDTPVTITNCEFIQNSSSSTGGALEVRGGPAWLTNCLLTQNSAPTGGALEVPGGSATLTNCILTQNSSPAGGAMHISGGDVSIENCIVWGNDEPVFADGLPTITFSDVQGGLSGYGNIDADPLFVDPDGPDDDPNTCEDNDYRLSAGSPCIDAGCNWAVPPDAADLDDDGDTTEITPLDLDDEGRFFDDSNTVDTGCGHAPIVDMGAYEFGGTGRQPCFGDLDDDRDVDLGDLATLLAHYGESDTCDGDLNCDGEVDLADLSAVLAVYGAACD